MKYQFQIENGYLAEGSTEIVIKDYITEIEEKDLTPAIKLLIEAHGGQLVDEKSKKKRKVKPVKWSKEEVAKETNEGGVR